MYTPTLTGLGERSHLLSGSINLETHITDIVNVFKWEDLENVVLCGHSYGGWVISGAIEQEQSRVSSIVFLDAFVPEDGETGYDLTPESNRTAIDEAVRTRAISRRPQPAESLQVNSKDRAWVDGKMTPQPIGVYFQKIRLTGARERVPRRTYIRATNFPSQHGQRATRREPWSGGPVRVLLLSDSAAASRRRRTVTDLAHASDRLAAPFVSVASFLLSTVGSIAARQRRSYALCVLRVVLSAFVACATPK